MKKQKKSRLLSLLSIFSILGLVSATVSFSVFANNTSNVNNDLNATPTSNTTTKNGDESEEKTSIDTKTYSFTPSRVTNTKPKQILVSNNSLFPTFSNGSSTKFFPTFNTSTSRPAISFANTYFTNEFLLNTPTSNLPLNEIDDNNTNFFIGYQIYQNGVVSNKDNYGAQIQQSYENPTGDKFLSRVTVSSLSDMYVNPGEVGIFSVQSSGAGIILNDEIGLLKMYEPSAGNLVKNWYIETNNQSTIDNTTFFYNIVVLNSGSSYEFYVPEESQNVYLYYNSQNGIISAPNSDLTASEYVSYLSANKSELDKFRVVSNNSLFSNADNYEFILKPDDKNGVISIDLKVNNFVNVTNIHDGNVYEILPSYTYEDVITFQGFRPDTSIELNAIDVLDLNDLYDPNTIANSFSLGKIQEQGLGIGVNSTQLYGVGTSNDKFIYDWPEGTGINPDSAGLNNPFDTSDTIKLFDFNNYGIGDNATINLIESIWSTLQIGINSNYYASFSNFQSNNTLSESEYSFIEPQSSSEQWLSFSTWNNYSQYLLNSVYTNTHPIDYNTSKWAQPFQIGVNSRYFSTITKLNSSNNATFNNNQPLAVNIKLRNDSGDSILNLVNGKGENAIPISYNTLTGNYGSYLASSGNKKYEYLTGVISQFNGEGYWVAPKSDTSISIDWNGGIDTSVTSKYTASDFLNGNLFGNKLKIRINGGIVNTLTDMSIKAYADDLNGVINVTLTPGVGVQSNVVSSNVSVNNSEINEYIFKQIEPIKFQIIGFKTNDLLKDTSITSSSLSIEDVSFLHDKTYITYAVNNYLQKNQSLAQWVNEKRFEIVASYVSNCMNNVYNVTTKEPISVYEGESISNALRSQLSSVNISIPSDKPNGYNNLRVSFDLTGAVSGGKIIDESTHYEFDLYFSGLEKIATTINPRINLVADEDQNNSLALTNTQIKYMLENSDLRQQLLSMLLTGYKESSDYFLDEQVAIGSYTTFNLPTERLDGQVIVQDFEDIKVKRNELVFSYPSDYYEQYFFNQAFSNQKSQDDELNPENSWTIKNVAINDKAVSFILSLKYYVNSDGIIEYSEKGKDFNSEFLGVDTNDVTTTLAQNFFFSPNTQLTAINFKDDYEKYGFSSKGIAGDIGTLILGSIYDIPEAYQNNINNLEIVKDTLVVNNIEGIVQFKVGLKNAYIKGQIYNSANNNNELFQLQETITIQGFKKVYPTTLSTHITAISYIDNLPPSNFYPTDISESISRLKTVISNDGLSNLRDDSIVELSNLSSSNLFVDNINGTIEILGGIGGAELYVTNYNDANGNLATGKKNFLQDVDKLVIMGFKTSKPTSLSIDSYEVSSNESILNFSTSFATRLIYNYIENVPSSFSSDDIIFNNFKVNLDNLTVTCDVYVRYGFNGDGILVNYRDTSDDSIDLNSILLLKTNFRFHGFNNEALSTSANQYGTNITEFNSYIASNYISFNGEYGEFNANGQKIKETIISKIVNSTFSSYPLIYNAPSFNESDVELRVQFVDNTSGSIRLRVYMKKYYQNGQYFETNNPLDDGYIGFMDIGGFKVLPSNPTTLVDSSYAVTGYSEMASISDNQAAAIISNSATSIFNNIPLSLGNINDQNANDNPNFNTSVDVASPSNMNVEVKIASLEQGQVNISSLLLNSYYATTNEDRLGKIVWINSNQKDFANGRFSLQGFKDWSETSISNRLDISNGGNDYADLLNLTPSEIVVDNTKIERLKRFIWTNGIINPSLTSNISNLSITSTNPLNTLGQIEFTASLNNWINNGSYPNEGELSPTPLVRKITIVGFSIAKPTNVPSNIIVSSPYDKYYPFDVDDELVKKIILDNTEFKPSQLSVDDIVISNITRNNFSGTISVSGLRFKKNYYDNYGNLATSQSPTFNDILIQNFANVTSSTTVLTNYNINSSLLPFEYLETAGNIGNYYDLKTLIINNMIQGDLVLNTNDLVISNIVQNNIAGTISLTLGLKRYINAQGQLIESNTEVWNQDITISQFSRVTSATSINNTLTIEGKSEIMASDFINLSPIGELKTLIVNKGVVGKWTSFSEEIIEIDESTLRYNNSLGQIQFSLSLNAWIDESGIYHNKNADGLSYTPLTTSITINGFQQVRSTYISEVATAFNTAIIPQQISENEIKSFVLKYLIVNKGSQMSENDLDVDYDNRVFNNALGRLEVKVRMLRNYYGDNGEYVSQNTPSSYYNVTLLTKVVASPTTILPTYSIANIASMSNLTSFEFVSSNTIDQSAVIKNELLNVGTNKMILFDNLPDEYNEQFSSSDIEIIPSLAENNENYIGIIGNGTLTLKIKLSKYMDNPNATYVTNNPKTFETILTGFRSVDDYTMIPNEFTIFGMTDELASNHTSSLSSNSLIGQSIIENIGNWKSDNKVSDLWITSLVSDNVNGSITANVRIKNFTDKNGILFDNVWSQEYTILIKGFKEITPTIFKDKNYDIFGYVDTQLLNILNRDQNFNYVNNTKYSDLNLAQIRKNIYFNEFLYNLLFIQIKKDGLNSIIENPTTEVEKLFANDFNFSTFSNLLRISNINFNYKNGLVSFDLRLLSYYSSIDGSLVENSNPLIATISILGFRTIQATSINTLVNSSKLSDTLASEWEKNSILLKRFVFSNFDLFVNNPAFDTTYNDIDISNVVANNLQGNLSFTLSLYRYFGNDGQYHDSSSEPLVMNNIILTGFKYVGGATAIRNVINVSEERIFSVNVLENLTPEIVQNGLYTYRNGSSIIDPIFVNLPTSFTRNDIVVSSKNRWTIDYKEGSAIIPVNLMKHIDSSGLEQNTSLPFNLILNGFKSVSGPTIVASEVDVSSLLGDKNAKSVQVEDIIYLLTSDSGLLESIFNENLQLGTICNLPSDFEPLTDIDDFALSPFDANNPNERILSFRYTNFFEQKSDGSISLNTNDWVTASVKLYGFKQLEETKYINYEWQLRDTQAIDYYTGNVTINQLSQFANEVIEKNIDNLAYDDTGVNVLTYVVIDETTPLVRDGSLGTITATIKLKNYVDSTSQINENEGMEAQITFTGFKRHEVTQSIGRTEISVVDSITNIPSIYLKTSSDLINVLNEQRSDGNSYLDDILGSSALTGETRTQVVDILGLNGVSIFDKTNPGQIKINDETGIIEFQLKVINTFTKEGEIQTNPTILMDETGQNPATIRLRMNSGSESVLRSGIDLNSSIFGLSDTSANLYSPDDSSIKQYILANLQNYIQLGNNGLVSQEITSQKIVIDYNSKLVNEKDGSVKFTIKFIEWWAFKNNGSLKQSNSSNYQANCTDDSVILITNDTKETTLKIDGFSIVNPEKTNFLLYFLIAAAGSLALMILAIIIVIAFKNKFSRFS